MYIFIILNSRQERHIIICKKNASKPRKIFDASKQRTIEGEGIPTRVHTRKKVYL